MSGQNWKFFFLPELAVYLYAIFQRRGVTSKVVNMMKKSLV